MKTYEMKINGEKYKTRIKKYKNDQVIVEVNGLDYVVQLEKDRRKEDIVRSDKAQPSLDVVKKVSKPVVAAPGAVLAPIPGLVLRILVKEGDKINVGDTVLILEAMKMESEIASTASGTINKINVKEGGSVQESDTLIEVGE
ncbi:MAG: acetyl-CoA carboxylase biotin carboxyl carrier protein subunit [Candidatus Cloacimonadota bacterium]|nr:MAG: acetyl-CoA carboxylase biotin carboxyl carrier protein subunit [Candidatus Cloacimonadota bacterium]HHE64686.1 acetyl-CoA carboxylase biotin carboxyl carrier protein subunit [Bacteroidota bacterium]